MLHTFMYHECRCNNKILVGLVAFTKAFNLATLINLLTHYAKGTPSFIFYKFRLLIDLLIQLFHLCLTHNSFKLSLTVLFTIAKFIILSLRGWFPYIPTSFLSSYFLFFFLIYLIIALANVANVEWLSHSLMQACM